MPINKFCENSHREPSEKVWLKNSHNCRWWWYHSLTAVYGQRIPRYWPISKLPYLGMKLGHWPKFQKLHICSLSTQTPKGSYSAKKGDNDCVSEAITVGTVAF